MTDLKPNAALAYRVLDHIKAHPEQWLQDWWFTITDCGTAGCFAGWTTQLSGDTPRIAPDASIGAEFAYVIRPDGVVVDVSTRAAEQLGIDTPDACALFAASNDLDDLAWAVTEIFGPRPAVTA